MRVDQLRREAPVSPWIIAALLSCGFFAPIGMFLPSIVLPQIEQAFANLPNAKLLTELIGALAGFGFAIGAPISGILIGRYGYRRVIVPALLLFAGTGAMPALLNDIWLILGCRLVVGLALSAIFTGALSGIGALPAGLRVRLLGWFSVVSGATSVFMFPLAGILGQLGWRPVFIVYLLAVPAIALNFRVPATLGSVEKEAAGTSGPEDSLLTYPMVRLLLLAALIGMMMLITPVYGPLFLAELGVHDSRVLSILPTASSVCSVAAAAAYGGIHRRLGTNGIFAVGLMVMGGSLIVAGFSVGMTQLVASIALFSAMSAIMMPNISAAALAVSNPRLGPQALGLTNGVLFGASLAFPFISTWLRAIAGMWGLFVLTGILLLMIGTSVAIATGFRARSLTAT